MGKKNKKLSSNVEFRRKKKKQTTQTERNPFEVRIQRVKHDVIGKKVNTDRGLPGVSRSKANEKRKRTLLKEYKQRHKSNAIIDRRFGEFDENLSIEEKMLKRFAMEKQKHHEKSEMYKLNDDDDFLTHMGQNIGDIANFDDAGLQLTDDEVEQNDGEEHFGGFLTKKKKTNYNEDQNDIIDKMTNKKLTKQEIMDEIVANSKKKKIERQQTQEKAFELTQKLDAEFKDILPLLLHQQVKKRDQEKPPADNYDITVNELFFESKAQASDRLKTEEEIAREEKEKLEEQEKQRRMRMLGITEDYDDEETDIMTSADALMTKKKKSADDRMEVHYKDGKMVLSERDEDMMKDADGDSGTGGEEEEGESDDEESEEEGESDHDDIYSDDNEEEASMDEEVEEKKEAREKKSKKEKRKKKEAHEGEVPFLFEVPTNLSDFLQLIEGRKDDEVITICQRIRKCHHVKLDSKNLTKMEYLFNVIVNFIDHVCKEPKPRLVLINKLAAFLNELSGDVKEHASKFLLKKLKSIFNKINKRIKFRGETGMFPTLSEMVFFKTLGLLYPTSDLNHPLTTPTIILMTMVLAKGHFKNIKDVVSGIFLLEIVYEYTNIAKRYLPEVITFLSKLLFLSAAVNTKIEKLPASILNLRKEEKNLLLVRKRKKKDPVPINLSTSLSLQTDASSLESDKFRFSCVYNVLRLAKKYCQLYKDLSSYNEIFSPCLSLLQRLPVEKYNLKTKTLFDEVVTLMSCKEGADKIPLTMHARKPKPLPLMEPQFDEHYEIRPKRRAGGKEENEMKKLKYKLKKETKGAMREIRKDAQFLAKEQLKERIHKDNVRIKKVRQLQNQIENERREIKEMEKGR